MEYAIGNLADFISGSNTPNKPNVVVKKCKLKSKKVTKDNVNDKNSMKNQEESKKKRKSDDTEAPQKINLKKVKKNKIKLNKPTAGDAINENKNHRINNNKEVDDEISTINKENNKRTLFVGNLPINVNKNILKRRFEKFGTVDSVRLRSAPIADERTPKKVAIIKKQFHKNRNSINAYIRFMDRKDAIRATKLNGSQYKDHHIRVKLCDDVEKPDQNKAIFLGNVCFDAEEDELWNLFQECGEIESVRLVRDGKTNVGKGFGYVNFKSADSVELALQMENVKMRNRELRISACVSKKSKNPTTNVNKPSDATKIVKTYKSGQDYQGKKIVNKKKKFNKGDVQKKKLIKKIAPK
ncbi:RNA-binding protein 34 [Onthophagus taurus]|uniref:RNA-binding protein 34 n=1 Tax=Onthophagus taurus TaxID=166361 RepID=UPI0039BEA6A6